MATILIVDDDVQLRELLATFLESKGHKVLLAADGQIALEQVRLELPDLVLTDLIMPNQEGLETIMALHRGYPQMNIIAMSGHSELSSSSLQAAGFLGARRMLAKPFSLFMLEQLIEQVLQAGVAAAREEAESWV